ncbi:TPA: hypothetical protein N0F65_001407 [Lagenidium giganteum]|uniref:Thioredoxin domain-containing protein n=1 Tax=Lagenidium giganteum TaxID=4803 RepID=A0AAV2Z1H7_9STRA|nr:TPA: hypothetical protein N0F65_001407 [Lagenidium giganteum]
MSNVTQRLAAARNHWWGERIVHLQGFEAAYEFVSQYDVQNGPLYVLFMSDADESGHYWCPDCEKAKQPIRVGEPAYWKDDNNEFRQNQLFYIDYIPTLMRYDGGGNSSAMLVEQYTLDANLLDYVFRVPNPMAGKPHNNQIMTIDDAKALRSYLDAYDASYPLFVFFLSGVHSFNGRLWCPYCDKADVAIMHYYNYTAPDNAVFIRAPVAASYKDWKRPDNGFKSQDFRDNVVSLRGVPFLGRAKKNIKTGKIQMEEFAPEFFETQLLKDFFIAASASTFDD